MFLSGGGHATFPHSVLSAFHCRASLPSYLSSSVALSPSLCVCLCVSPACPMGNSPNRLYNALAQTFSSAPLSQHIPALQDQDQDQDPVDPMELLRECEEALRARPARLHRAFFCQNGGRDCHQQQPIRVMQWNILAQGKRALHICFPVFECAF